MPRRSAALPAFFFCLALIALPRFARAQDPFSIDAQTTTGPTEQVTVSGSSVIDLVQNLVESEEQFAAFAGQGFSASLNYGRIDDAIQVTRNAAGTSATVTIPSTGFSRTFTGEDEDEVLDEIEDFLLKEGAEEYAKFLGVVNQRSLIAVVDGNPLAATAQLSNSAFFKFGLQRSPLDAGSLAGSSPWGPGLRFDVNAGLFTTAEEGDGFYVAGGLSSAFRLGDRIGLSLSTPFSYREVEGAKVYMGGIEAGVPIVILKPLLGRGVVWQVTPHVVGAAAGSEDLAAGGTFFGYGGTSSLSVPLGRSTALTVGNGIYFYEGYPLDIGEYEFDTDLSQQVIKNGVKLTQGLGPLSLDAGITHTDFLDESAIDYYWSPTVGLVGGLGTVGVRVAYQGDFGEDYESHGGTVTLYLNY